MQRRYERPRAIAKAQVAFDPSTASGTILLIATGAALFAAINLVPPPLLLPVLAVVSIAVAAVVAILGWWLGVTRDRKAPILWDIAGACLLIGIAAGVFSDAHQATEAIASLLP
jgi:ABC-type Fe3+-siderophore transport system permease subunit